MPFLSVIIPTFNRKKYIIRALDSVLAQTYRNFDIQVIDDGGNDGTGNLVRTRADQEEEIQIHYTHTPNRGVAAARNLGIRRSGGDWIALLDSDDEWLPEKLEKQVDFMRHHPGISLIHTGETWIRKGIRVNPPRAYRKYGGDVFENCLPVCMIGPSTALFSRHLFEEAGGFDEEYPVCEDYDFWLRVTSRYEAGFVDAPLTVKYGGHNDQLSTTTMAMDYWRIRSMCRILQIRDLTPVRRAAVLDVIRRKGRILLNGYRKHDKEEQYREVLSMIHGVDERFYPD